MVFFICAKLQANKLTQARSNTMSSTMILHSGAREASRDEVYAVPTPSGSDTWQPVPHQELLDGVLSRLTSIGLQIRKEQHGLQAGGLRWFGVFDMAARSGGKDYGVSIGLRNSHDQSWAAGAVMGANVFVCDNTSFSGEVQFMRKHSRLILQDLPQILDQAVVKLSTLEDYQEVRFNHYRNSELSDAQVNDFLVRSVMGKALPLTRLPKVFGEWKRPSHEEFAGRTAWSLFNAYTEVFKTTSRYALPARSQRLHQLFDRFVGTPKMEVPESLTLAQLQEKAAAAATN
jgi:hypothetical protein